MQAKTNYTTRRTFITGLAALPVALAAGDKIKFPRWELDPEKSRYHDDTLISDPTRHAAITAWAAEIEQVIVSLVKLHNFVWAARSKSPEQVSGPEYLSLEQTSLDLMDSLCGAMQSLSPDGSSIIETMTGKREVFACFALDISRGALDRDFWQAEIDAIAEYDPVGAAELQAGLDSYPDGHFRGEA